MYDLYSASMNFSSPQAQYPGYYPYSNTPNELQPCMQQAVQQEYRGFDQYNMNSTPQTSLLTSRVPPLSHPPLPMVETNYRGFYDQSYHYKNYLQNQSSYSQQINQYVTSIENEYCDDEKSEKSSDVDQGKAIEKLHCEIHLCHWEYLPIWRLNQCFEFNDTRENCHWLSAGVIIRCFYAKF